MARDIAGQIDTLRERIQTSGAISDADRDILAAFDDRLTLLQQDYSDYRHKKLLRHTVIMAEEVGGLADAISDRDTAETVVAWINRTYDNEETNRDYRSALRVFGKHVTDGDDVPEALAWIPTGTSSDYDPTPDPRNMLQWEEHVVPMTEHCHNDRDAAMIAVQFDGGFRGGEFKSLTVGDVQDHKHGLQVTVDGKQGRRTVTLIPSVPYLQQWLADHPAPDVDDAPLWSKVTEPDSVSDRMIGKAFSRAADRAGVDKPVTLTNFRKSSAAFLASRNLNQAHIEDHHGWVRGSDAAARYISVFADDTDRELAKLHGKDVDEADEPDEIAPRECPRCGKETPRDKDLCVWCGQALEPGAAEEAEQVDDILVRSIADADGERARELLDLRDEVANDPEARAEAIDKLLD